MTIEQYISKNPVYVLEGGHLPLPVHQKTFKKNETVTRLGRIESNVYFIKSGIIEIDIFKESETKIVDFYFENDFVCALTSFLLQKPTEAALIALTPLEVEYVTYADVQKAYKNSLLINQLGRHIIEQAYLAKFQRERDFLTKTADIRYLELMKTRPELLNLLPVHKIAQYLGIHPESLSRIRKSVIS